MEEAPPVPTAANDSPVRESALLALAALSVPSTTSPMAYQDKQRALAERRARERQHARSRLRRSMVFIAVCVSMIWGMKAYPLLHEGPRLSRVAGVTGLIGILGVVAYLRHTRELTARRLKRPTQSALLAVVCLGGGLLGAFVGVAAFHIGNGVFDRGPITTTAYDVVAPPTVRRCGRHGCDVGLRSRDDRNELVTLSVRGRVFDIDWRGMIVEIDTRPGRFGSPWILARRYVRAAVPVRPLPVPGHIR